MKVRTMTLAGVALVAVVALGVLGTLRWASAIGSDVNNDGTVNIIDIGHIVRDFGQTVPTEPLEILEQNLDETGNIKVHEQGVVDVRVVEQPSIPLEFTHILAVVTATSSTGYASATSGTTELDVDELLTTLSAQGWELVRLNVITTTGLSHYTLARPAVP